MSQHNIVEVRIPILNREVSVRENEFGGAAGGFEAEMRKMEEEMTKLTGEISEGNKRIQSRIVQTTKTTTTRTSSSGTQLDQMNQGQQQQQQQFQITAPPQQIQFSSPTPVGSQIGSNVQSSTSTHTTRTQSNVGGQQIQQQQTPIQFSSPTGGSVQSTSSTHTTRTHSTTGTQQQQQLQQQQQQQQLQSQQFNSQQQFSNDSSNNTELQQWMANLDSPLIAGRQEISGQDGKCLRLRFDVSQYRPDEISVKTVDGKLKIHAKHEEKSETKSAYREFNKEFSLPFGTNPEAIKSTLSKDGILTVEAPLPGQQGQLMYQQNLPISNY